MARPRRTITDEGMLYCGKGEHWVHISQFGQAAGAYVCIRNRETGIDQWFGKPNSWCKDCVKQHNKEKREAERALAERLAANAMPTQSNVRYATDVTPQPLLPVEAEEGYKDLSLPPEPDMVGVKLGPPVGMSLTRTPQLVRGEQLLEQHGENPGETFYEWPKEDQDAFYAAMDVRLTERYGKGN